MDNTSHTSSVTLGSQVRRILRHPVLILVSVVVFALAGAAYGYMTNGKYTAKVPGGLPDGGGPYRYR